MSIQMDIQIGDDLPDSIEEPPPSSQMLSWAQAAWQGDEKAQPVVSLRVVSKRESQELNANYRNKDKPTNVLSFPLAKDEGEILITPKCAERQAKEFGKTNKQMLGYLFVHGMLHLNGMQHSSKMEQAEKKFCRMFKI